jgi:hypothetical protein
MQWNSCTGFIAALLAYFAVFTGLVFVYPVADFLAVLPGLAVPGIAVFFMGAIGALKGTGGNRFEALAGVGCASWAWVFIAMTPPGWLLLLLFIDLAEWLDSMI